MPAPSASQPTLQRLPASACRQPVLLKYRARATIAGDVRDRST